MQLTLVQLDAVLCVAEERSFSRAARRQLVAQSSLSRTVAQVERMCGAKLFDRTTRQLEVTVDGERFVQTARAILSTYRQEMSEFDAYLAGTKGVLRLAALPSLAVSLLPPMITRFRHRFPDIAVEVEDVLEGQVVDYIRDNAVDLAVTAEPPPSVRAGMSGVRFDVIAVDEFRCILPERHRLLDRPAIHWADLAGEAFIAFDDASSVRRIVDDILRSRGVVPARVLTVRNVASVAGLCAAGLGVSAAPGFVLPLMSVPGVVTRPIGDVPVHRRIGVLRGVRRKPSPAARQFLAIISAAADEITLPAGAYWEAHPDLVGDG
ncbi:LysR family transcriptional regulator [Mycolicibacterium sp. S2-37]|uniref:LysR family transcriptional regulator n=1 Tax=Mycolicibacterium sp. S2-37 TaxID=2810297 RepID=UPI001F5E4EF1|nr:LysR family transcriptional regulator [Mycolicibacterium sp. S2-37]